MPERRVRVVCHNCPPEHKGRVRAYTGGFEEYGPQLHPCQWCSGEGTYPATIADPAAEALMADGERYRAGAVRVRQREPFGDVPDGVEWESPTPEAP